MTVATDADALLSAILAAPADDAPRLIFADWLDEHGEPERAEFIRCQIELARHQCAKLQTTSRHADSPTRGPCSGCNLVAALRQRERGLLNDRTLHEWFPWRGLDGFTFLTLHPASFSQADAPFCVVSRGFIAHVAADLREMIGGPCSACADESPETRAREDAWRGRCSKCDGFGRTPGILAELVKREPVVSFTVSDRRPWSGEENRHGYGWARMSEGLPLDGYEGNHWIPADVYDLLPTGWGDEFMMNYPNETVATDALSAALLAYAANT